MICFYRISFNLYQQYLYQFITFASLHQIYQMEFQGEINLTTFQYQQTAKIPNKDINQIQIITIESIHKLKLGVSINKIFLNGLLKGSQTCTKAKSSGRSGLIYTKQVIKNKFGYNFNILKLNNYGIAIQIDIFMKITDKKYSYSTLNIHYQSNTKWQTIHEPNLNQQDYTVAYFKLNDIFKLIEKYHIFLEFQMEWKSFPSSTKPIKFCGLKNIGNSCYMNSYLQSLFFIRIFRKKFFEIELQKKDQLINALQDCFYKMMNQDGNQVDPRDILSKNQRFKGFRYLQQDLGQFKAILFEQLQKYSKQLQNMFKFELKQIIDSKQSNKYHTQQNQYSYELNLEVIKNNRKLNLLQSLKLQIEPQQINCKTQEFGEIQVKKRYAFLKLPDIMVFSLKRYEFIQQTIVSKKITSKFQFQKEINVGFLLNQPEIKYTLYAIIVHEGEQVDKGHYYIYINVSNNSKNYQWYKFNDSIVGYAQQEEAIQRNFGGIQNKLSFRLQNKIFEEKSPRNFKTAYMLIYIKQSQFDQIQRQNLQMPLRFRSISQKQNKINIQKGKQTTQKKTPIKSTKLKQIDIVISDNLIPEKVSSIFSDECIKYKSSTISIDLNSGLYHQLNQASNKIFQEQSFIWRVSRIHRSVFNLKRLYKGKQITAQAMLYGDTTDIDDSIYILITNNKQGIISQQMQKDGQISLIQLSKISNQKLILTNLFVVQTAASETILANKILSKQLILKKDNFNRFDAVSLNKINQYKKSFHCNIVQCQDDDNQKNIDLVNLMI